MLRFALAFSHLWALHGAFLDMSRITQFLVIPLFALECIGMATVVGRHRQNGKLTTGHRRPHWMKY